MTMTQEREDTGPRSLWTPDAARATPPLSLWVPGGTHPVAHSVAQPEEDMSHTSHNGTDPDPSATVARRTPVARKRSRKDTMHVSETHRDALAAMGRKADQVRYVCEMLGHPETAEVRHWLESAGVAVDAKYVSRVVNEWRSERDLSDTGTFRALTADVLAEVETSATEDDPSHVAQSVAQSEDDTSHTSHSGTEDDPSATVAHVAQSEDDTSHSPSHVAHTSHSGTEGDPSATVAHVAQSEDDTDTSPVVLASVVEDDPAVSRLAEETRRARALIPLQADSALLSVLSDDEVAAERELAERVRAADREMRWAGKAVELANLKRAQATAEAIAKSEAADARWLERAVSARRRLVSPDAKLAQLYRRAEWSSRALIAVVVLGMVWSGVNVQHNLVPSGDMSDPLYWLSYGIEAMISVPLIVIMVASTTASRWGRTVNRSGVVLIELALLATTIGLNVGPHLANDPGKAAEYAVAPVMVGVMIWVHAWVSNHYATLITEASTA